MLEARKKNFNENKVVTIIGPGTKVKGELSSQGTIRVEGVVEGQVQSTDTIVIQENGKVKADLIAGQVVISGEVHGNVYAQERLEITEHAKVFGDITSPRISIAEGVVFEGKCTMKSPTPKQMEGNGGGAAPQQKQQGGGQPQPAKS
jgi:cytoskeletal protein CcmA (bactofilin family)